MEETGDTLSLSTMTAMPDGNIPIACVQSTSIPAMDRWVLSVKQDTGDYHGLLDSSDSDSDDSVGGGAGKRRKKRRSRHARKRARMDRSKSPGGDALCGAGAGERFRYDTSVSAPVPGAPALSGPGDTSDGTLDLSRWASAFTKLSTSERGDLVKSLSEAAERGWSADKVPAAVQHMYRDIVAATNRPEELKVVRLPPGAMFSVLPETDASKRHTIYVAGPAGCGKSYWVSGYTRLYAEMYPDRPRWLISQKKHDVAFDTGIGPRGSTALVRRISIADLTRAPVDIEKDFQGPALIIFDDIDALEKAEFKIVHNIMMQVINVGRAVGLSVIVTNHLLTDFHNTRGIIHDANYVVLYPQSVLAESIRYMGQKMGLTKDQVKNIKKFGRWVCICKQGAKWMCGEGRAEIIE